MDGDRTSLIAENVSFGAGCEIGPYSIIGSPRREIKKEQDGNDHLSQISIKRCVIGNNVIVGARSFIGDGTEIGDRCDLGVMSYVGHDSSLGCGTEMFHKAQILDRVAVGEECWIGGFLCNDAEVGDRAIVYGKLIHKFVDAVRGVPETPPTVCEEAFVGEGSIVIGGVIIGAGAYVAAGSIVTRSVPESTLVAGNPARIVGSAPKPFKNYSARFL